MDGPGLSCLVREMAKSDVPVRGKPEWHGGGDQSGQCNVIQRVTVATWCAGGAIKSSPDADRPERSGGGRRMTNMPNARSRVKKR